MKKPSPRAKTKIGVTFADNAEMAYGIAVSDCEKPGCTCGNLAILLFNTDQEVFSFFRISLHAAERLALDLLKVARGKIGGNA